MGAEPLVQAQDDALDFRSLVSLYQPMLQSGQVNIFNVAASVNLANLAKMVRGGGRGGVNLT